MNWKDCYSDVCAEIRIMGIREMELRKRVELAHKAMFTGELPSSGSYCHLPLDKGIEQYNTAVTELEAIQVEVDRLNELKLQMEEVMQEMTGLPNRITALRLRGFSLKAIADHLGYAPGYIRNLSSKRTG